MPSTELDALRRTVASTAKLIQRPPINAGLAEEMEAAERPEQEVTRGPERAG